VKVAGLQLDIAWEQPDENLQRASALAADAAAAGANLLVLPEMFATGFSMRAEAMAEHAPRVRVWMSELARRHQVFVCAGYAEPGEERPANACSVHSPTGEELLHYRKIHPFTLAHEPDHYEAGRTLRTVAIDGVRVTPLICYDLRFPELFRAAADATDLFLVLANWPERRSHAWRTLLQARAIDCQAWVLGVNRVGEAEGHPHRGDTALVDPWGKVLNALAHEPGVVDGEVDAEVVVTARSRFSFLTDRRPEVYRRLREER
jgi:predicted amidohydrolase